MNAKLKKNNYHERHCWTPLWKAQVTPQRLSLLAHYLFLSISKTNILSNVMEWVDVKFKFKGHSKKKIQIHLLSIKRSNYKFKGTLELGQQWSHIHVG